jgi:betaine reductase
MDEERWQFLPEQRCYDLRTMVELNGKRVIAIGERDGVQGDVIRDIAAQLGAEVVFSITQCFV